MPSRDNPVTQNSLSKTCKTQWTHGPAFPKQQPDKRAEAPSSPHYELEFVKGQVASVIIVIAKMFMQEFFLYEHNLDQVPYAGNYTQASVAALS